MGRWSRVAFGALFVVTSTLVGAPAEAQEQEPEGPEAPPTTELAPTLAPVSELPAQASLEGLTVAPSDLGPGSTAASVATVVPATPPPPAPAVGGDLFGDRSPAPPARTRLPAIAEDALRRRFTRIDPAAIADTIADVQGEAAAAEPEARAGRRPFVPGRPVTLELFDGVRRTFQPTEVTLSYPATVDADGNVSYPDRPYVEWHGRTDLENRGSSTAVLGLVPQAGGGYSLLGSISDGGKRFEVAPVDGARHLITEDDPNELGAEELHLDDTPTPPDAASVPEPPSTEPGDAPGAVASAGTPDAPEASGAAAAGPVLYTIDVMTILTPGVFADGDFWLNAQLNGALETTNTNFRVNAKVKHVSGYTTSGDMGTDLDRLYKTSDGILDEVHNIRTQWGADVVAMTLPSHTPGICGVGYVPNPGGVQSWAFSVSAVHDELCELTYGHEVGHNLGGNHNPENAGSGAGPSSYARGHWVNYVGRTIMSYGSPCAGGNWNNCPAQNQFSNPSVPFLSNNGHASGWVGVRDNRSSMQNLAPYVSGYRSDNPYGSLSLVQRRPGGLRVRGTARDPNNTSAIIDVHVYVGSTGYNLGPTTASHTFDQTISFNTAGTFDVCAYGINAPGTPGSNAAVGCQQVTVSNSPFGSFDSVVQQTGALQFNGWAIDPDTTTPADVHVYVGQTGFNIGAADVSRPDVGSAYPGFGSLHGFSASRDFNTAGNYNICAYAINVPGTPGGNSLIGCKQMDVYETRTISCVSGPVTWTARHDTWMSGFGPLVKITGLSRTEGGATTDAASLTWERRWDLAPNQWTFPPDAPPPSFASHNSDQGGLSVVGAGWRSVFDSPRLVAPDGGCDIYLAPFVNLGSQPTWPQVGVLGDQLLMQLNDTSYNSDDNIQGYAEGQLNGGNRLAEVEGHNLARWTQPPGATGLIGSQSWLLDEFRGLADQGVTRFVFALGANDARAVASGAETQGDVNNKMVAAIEEIDARNVCVTFVTAPEHDNSYGGAAYTTAVIATNNIMRWVAAVDDPNDDFRIIDFASEAKTHRHGDQDPWFQADNLHLNWLGRYMYTYYLGLAGAQCP